MLEYADIRLISRHYLEETAIIIFGSVIHINLMHLYNNFMKIFIWDMKRGAWIILDCNLKVSIGLKKMKSANASWVKASVF